MWALAGGRLSRLVCASVAFWHEKIVVDGCAPQKLVFSLHVCSVLN